MPSMLTSRTGSSTSTTGAGRTLSKVNSFQRTWDDDEDTPSSGRIPWSTSPEPAKTKPLETAAERRRKAIMAALEPNTIASPSTATSSTRASTSASTSSKKISAPVSMSSTMINGIRVAVPRKERAKEKEVILVDLDDEEEEKMELPSIPKDLPSRKRQLPWDEDVGTTKATRAGSTSSTTSKRANSTGSRGTMDAKTKLPKTFLSVEQQQVLQKVLADGENIFFTGSAGTGKSVLLREIISGLKKKYVNTADAVAVTASTGIAACNIGGVTLHSFGGVGLALEEASVLMGKLKKNKKAVARWLRTKALIIDEISMVDGEMFDKFNKIGQMIRKNSNRPFGGMQIIVTGDFFQLPPVTKGGQQPKFCFDAQTWNETISMSVNLTKVFRQKDQRFIDMLNEMRFGKLSQASITAFKALARPIEYDDGIEPTVLFPRREDVDRANSSKLSVLNTDGYTYTAVDGGTVVDPTQRAKLLANFMAPATIPLKINAQVMLIKNLDDSLVNGSMGKVIGFEHKNLYETDQNGQWVDDNYWSSIEGEQADEKRMQRKKILMQHLSGNSRPDPVVRFNVPLPGGGTGTRDLLVEFDTFKTELPNGEVQASRNQLPLILAWAMSIHKSQGQTLDRVKVDLGKVFEKGQAYVALSRATSLEGLQVLGFDANKVQAHKRVAVWSSTLKDLNTKM